MLPKRVTEASVSFEVGQGFYRPQSKIIRDLGVLAAVVYRQEYGQLQVLDGMAATGVRSRRYAMESRADFAWTNDADPDLEALLTRNLGDLGERHRLTLKSFQRLCLELQTANIRFDLVDVDSFGAPAALLPGILEITRFGGLLYVTSTDGRSLTGHLPVKSLRDWGAWSRAHPASHEQGLRLLIGGIQQTAASLGLGIEPVFSFFTGETYRVMVQLAKRPVLNEENFGFTSYCHHCGEYSAIAWKQLGKVICSCQTRPVLSGPLWRGKLHCDRWLESMRSQATKWQWTRAESLLALMQAENSLPPYFYLLGDIGRRGQSDIPPKQQLIQALHHQGFSASGTHVHGEGLKTTASLKTCVAIAKSLAV
ncbi:MAG: tRNA (guanine-N1)-methyltransferase [Cyanobacteria bacterium P01_H01_bin.15]